LIADSTASLLTPFAGIKLSDNGDDVCGCSERERD
jgi:hypothetical protein